MRSNIGVCRCDRSRNSFRTRGVGVRGNKVAFSFVSPVRGIANMRLKRPIPVGVAGNITTVTVTRLGNYATSRLHGKVGACKNISHHFSFGVGGSGLMFLSSCTRRPGRVCRDTGDVHRLCGSHGVATVFRPRLCAHAHSFCGSFTGDLDLLSRIVLYSVCPTHRRPVPKIASGLVCSGLGPNMRGDVVRGRSMLNLIGDHSFSMLIILKTNSLSGCIPRVAGVLRSGWTPGVKACTGGGGMVGTCRLTRGPARRPKYYANGLSKVHFRRIWRA